MTLRRLLFLCMPDPSQIKEKTCSFIFCMPISSIIYEKLVRHSLFEPFRVDVDVRGLRVDISYTAYRYLVPVGDLKVRYLLFIRRIFLAVYGPATNSPSIASEYTLRVLFLLFFHTHVFTK